MQQFLNFQHVHALLDVRRRLEENEGNGTAEWTRNREALERVFQLLQRSSEDWVKRYCELTQGNIPDALHFLIYDLFRHQEEVGQEALAIVYAMFQIPVLLVLAKGDEFQSDMVDYMGAPFDIQNVGADTQISLIAHVGEVHFEPILKIDPSSGVVLGFTHSGTSMIMRRIKDVCRQ